MNKANWLKTSCLILVVFAMAASTASAWQVTVFNQGPYKATINVLVNKAFFCSVHSTADIPPNGNHVFDTGAWCPGMVTGVAYDESGNQMTVHENNCNGDWNVQPNTVGCAGCCYDVQFTLCPGTNWQGKHFYIIKRGLVDCSKR